MTKTNNMGKRFICACLTLVFTMTALWTVIPTRAAEVPQTLKVYAQYWADADSTVLLREYTRAELEELTDNEDFGFEGYYCNVTRVNTVMRIHARGVRLAEFLRDSVGVDLNSVRQLDFHTTDISADARFVSKGRWELLDSPRYYYPNLVANPHTDWDNDQFVIDDEEAAIEGAVTVPTIIAIEQYSTKNPKDDLSGAMTVDTSFRLCAGQPEPDNGRWLQTSFESAKWVDEIYVVFAGSPPEPSTDPEPTTEEEPSTKGSEDQNPSVPDQEEPDSDSDADSEPEEQDEPGTTKQNVPSTQIVPPGTTKRQTENTTTTTTTTTAGSISTTSTTTTTRKQNVAVVTRSYSSTTRVERQTESTTTIPDKSNPEALMTNGSGNMGQLVVNGYGDSLIQWKKDSPDDIAVLQKPLVTTEGVRNAVLLFIVSFAGGAVLMFRWFKKEK